MNQKGTYLTRDGLQKLQAELHDLKNNRRREIAERIQQAKELGDLSENAEYVEAKTEQAFTEGRIMELEAIIRDAILIDEQQRSDTIDVGSSLTAEVDGTTMEFSIVGSNEADPAQGKISNESPLGSAFIGKKAGEKVIVQTPGGAREYEILTVR